MIPFSAEQFFSVFEEYNRAVFPFQALLLVIAIVAAYLAAKPNLSSLTSLLLASLWIWMGIAYHFLFFSQVSPAAYWP